MVKVGECKMCDEKVYVMEDGSEYVLGDRLDLNDKRFLLLYEKKTDEVFIAYEEDDKLKFIDDSFPGYSDIFGLLFEKIQN